MLSARNIHFAILGIILGATSGYIFAFYQFESSLPDAPAVPAGQAAGDHPEISDEQMVAVLKQAVDANPNDPNAVGRYANMLFNLGQYEEAVTQYRRVIELDPKNLEVRSLLGAVLWRLLRFDEAATELQAALNENPNHIPSLHGMALLAVERRDFPEVERLMEKIKGIDAAYGGLDQLQQRLAEVRGAPAP